MFSDPLPGGYVFVIAYGRSGSTLVQAVLNAMPGVCVRGENGAVLTGLCDSWRRLRDTPQLSGARRSATESAVDAPWYGAELGDPEVYARALGTAFERGVLALPENCHIGGCKEIRFHEGPGGWNDVLPMDGPRGFATVLDFIGSAFPGARFVFNTRDGAAIARSGWWARVSADRVQGMVEKADALFDASLAYLPRGSAIRLRYEDYASDPAAFAPLYALMGVPFDEATAAGVAARRLFHTGI